MRLLTASERFAYGVLDECLFLAVFRGRCRTLDMTTMRESLAAFVQARAPRPVAVLVIIEYRATLGERGRAEVAGMLSDASGHVTHWANVVEGEGFWASTFRGITLTVSKLARYDFPLKTFATVETAVPWLAAQSRVTATTLADGVKQLRGALQGTGD
jgi:hypothetical protein